MAPLGKLAHLGEIIFIPHSYGITYLSSVKNVIMSLEKDCFDLVVLKRNVFFLFSVRLSGCSNSILLYKIIYSGTSSNFTCIVSELKKYVKEKYNKFANRKRSLMTTILKFKQQTSKFWSSHQEVLHRGKYRERWTKICLHIPGIK